MIILFYNSNGLFISNIINHGVFFSLEKFQKYENYNYSCKIKNKSQNLKNKTFSKPNFSK